MASDTTAGEGDVEEEEEVKRKGDNIPFAADAAAADSVLKVEDNKPVAPILPLAPVEEGEYEGEEEEKKEDEGRGLGRGGVLNALSKLLLLLLLPYSDHASSLLLLVFTLNISPAPAPSVSALVCMKGESA